MDDVLVIGLSMAFSVGLVRGILSLADYITSRQESALAKQARVKIASARTASLQNDAHSESVKICPSCEEINQIDFSYCRMCGGFLPSFTCVEFTDTESPRERVNGMSD